MVNLTQKSRGLVSLTVVLPKGYVGTQVLGGKGDHASQGSHTRQELTLICDSMAALWSLRVYYQFKFPASCLAKHNGC